MTATRDRPPSEGGATIRRAGATDIEILAALQAACFNDPWSRDSVGRLVAAPASLTQLALVPGPAGQEPAGFALWRSTGPEGELLLLGVAPDARRRGIGRRLLAAGIAALRSRGARELYLEVSESNVPAVALYQDAGFHVAGHRPDYYPGSTAAERTALVMACRLDSKDMPAFPC